MACETHVMVVPELVVAGTVVCQALLEPVAQILFCVILSKSSVELPWNGESSACHGASVAVRLHVPAKPPHVVPPSSETLSPHPFDATILLAVKGSASTDVTVPVMTSVHEPPAYLHKPA